MFGWLKDRLQEGVYRTTLREIEARFFGDVGSMALINAGAAMSVVQFVSELKGVGVIDFEAIRDDRRSRFNMLTADEWYILENQLLDSAAAVSDRSRHSDYILQVAAGFCSCNKRQSFDSETAVAIVNSVRTGADACITLGISPSDDMAVALPRVVGFFLKA